MNRRAKATVKKPLTDLIILVLVSYLFIWTRTGLAQEVNVDVNALTAETQKMSQKSNEITMVWWIPEEFWRASFAQDSTMTNEQAENLIDILRPYTIVVVVDGKMGALGGVTYTPEADIRKSLRLIDVRGANYTPLDETKLSPDFKNFVSVIKPVFANMLGPMGQNMHIVVFPGKNNEGGELASAKKEGMLVVKLGKRDFKWRLPLGSVIPPKTCPVDGEKLNGGWKYCPWHGAELK